MTKSRRFFFTSIGGIDITLGQFGSLFYNGVFQIVNQSIVIRGDWL